ncbi:hypothetical protein POJ06DRAFT_72733 [Lipomyces tetrasporus]|uniref:Uncharacterized protein n=1 Tax=Lipomyces tetrasporus TaxID=54092 RepID=A0AAD7QUW3_9ASCO|nr:uncharacterized protein POJ06DRAFT_72733 [Lipomyces tetrasporus]KAJ8101879.1 hypothetical protein POJ06DRAFT_72733 [Lipomyces tetrasporus]
MTPGQLRALVLQAARPPLRLSAQRQFADRSTRIRCLSASSTVRASNQNKNKNKANKPAKSSSVPKNTQLKRPNSNTQKKPYTTKPGKESEPEPVAAGIPELPSDPHFATGSSRTSQAAEAAKHATPEGTAHISTADKPAADSFISQFLEFTPKQHSPASPGPAPSPQQTSSVITATNIFMDEPVTLQSVRAKVESEIFGTPPTARVSATITGDAFEALEFLIKKWTGESGAPRPGAIAQMLDGNAADAQQLIYDILKFPQTVVDDALLRRYFLLRPATSRAVDAMSIFYEREENKRRVISKSTYMIPFRKCLRDEDVDGAFKIVDLTANSPQWLTYVKQWWQKAALVWIAGSAGIVELADVFMKSDLLVAGGLENTGVIKVMIIAYLLNSSLLGFVACASRPGDNGGKVLWRHGVFQTTWYMHAQESRMLNMIVDMDIAQVENEGDVSRRVLHELAVRDRRLGDNAYDNLVKEYWAKQGQGFEWAEPDIDPAEETKIARDADKMKKLRLDAKQQHQLQIDDENAGWIKRVLQTQTDA